VPGDNPFIEQPDDPETRSEIWAYGFRNPFTMALDPQTGTLYANDVGENNWEEIDEVIAGANYGWPECEGPFGQSFCMDNDSDFTDPVHAYSQSTGGCAITGGAFYRADAFSATYDGSYFFADYCGDWIRQLHPDGTVTTFATDTGGGPVDLDTGPDGSLYYLSYGDGAVYRISYVSGENHNPTAAISASVTFGTAPLEVQFDASNSSDADEGDVLTFTWDFDDGTDQASGVQVTHTFESPGQYDVTLTVDDGNEGTDSATVQIRVGTPPVGEITSPADGAFAIVGDTIEFEGTASDAEDGDLEAEAFTWEIVLHHHLEDDPLHHVHLFLGPLEGIESGSFLIDHEEIHDSDIWFRIHLTVTDSDGLTHESASDVFLQQIDLTLDTEPSGLTLAFQGQPADAPFTRLAPVGAHRDIEANSPQQVGEDRYVFASWSNGGEQAQTLIVPAEDTTLTAAFVLAEHVLIGASVPEYVVPGSSFDALVYANAALDAQHIEGTLIFDPAAADLIAAEVESGIDGCADTIEEIAPGEISFEVTCDAPLTEGVSALWKVAFRARHDAAGEIGDFTVANPTASDGEGGELYTRSASSQAAFVVPGVCGDLTGGDRVDLFDVLTSLHAVVDLLEPSDSQRVLGDLDRSGSLDLADTMTVLARIVGAIPELTDCGPAPQLPEA
jgi:PKD repeat protein